MENKRKNLSGYRASLSEQARIADLLKILPPSFEHCLDIGARDGYISFRLAERCDQVVALDLSPALISHPKVLLMQGNATALPFSDDAFDVVLCTEVLEHIPSGLLEKACREIARVTSRWVLIGVPFRQDLRFGSTRCRACGTTNPPWGHVNCFTLEKLNRLFTSLRESKVSYIGETKAKTNFVSHLLMEYAGHPYGTYSQEETCIHCGSQITYQENRTLTQRLCTRLAHLMTSAQQRISPPKPAWIHILFEKG